MSRNKSLAVPMKATKKPPKLQKLTATCLTATMSDMSLKEILNMVSANRKLLAIVPFKAMATKCNSIEGNDIKEYDEDLLHDFFTALATKCGSLQLVQFDESTLRTYLFSLQNLTELSLKDISLSVQNVQRMPRKLKSLTLDNCVFEEAFGSESWWFECLSPTLNQLTIKSTSVKGLEELMNLTHFHMEGRFKLDHAEKEDCADDHSYYRCDYRGCSTCCTFLWTKPELMIARLLINNRNSLKSLNLLNCHGHLRKLLELGQFKNLETLSVDIYLYWGYYGDTVKTDAFLPDMSCNNLKTLTIHTYDKVSDCKVNEGEDNPVNNFLATLNCGGSLQKLTIHFDWWLHADFSKLKALQYLELRGGGTCIPNLPHQTKLETLIMCDVNVRHWEHFVEMKLPFKSLRTLTLREISATRDLRFTRDKKLFDSRVEGARSWLEKNVFPKCKWEFSASRKTE